MMMETLGRHRVLYRLFIPYFVCSFLWDLTFGARIGWEISINSEDNLLTTIGRLIRRNASLYYHTF
jgi:hypothetical protein